MAMLLKRGLETVWQDKWEDLIAHCQQAIDTLNHSQPPPRIKATDKRHTTALQYEKKGIPYGVYHLGIWVEQGEANNVPSLSSETRLLTNIRHQAVLNSFRRVAPLVHAINLFFERVDPEAFRAYQTAYKEILSLTSLNAYHYSGKSAFLAHTISRNLTVEPHKDRGDLKRDGWLCAVLGNSLVVNSWCLPCVCASISSQEIFYS